MKYFIITVDTEGDNLWGYRKGDEIKTENSLYIPRFQELCNKFGYKPVWLTNYEMANDIRYVNYIKKELVKGNCEVGIHIHAWNNPPMYNLNAKYSGNPYLIEYPVDIMQKKFAVTYNLIKEKIGIYPKSHRAGRWVMNSDYFKILKDFGILVDCSYTPYVSWERFPGETIPSGSDYTNVVTHNHFIHNVLEVPMTIRKIHFDFNGNIKHFFKTLLYGDIKWMRPAITSLLDMKKVIKCIAKEHETDYVEFMIHSSELMPGGSPYFPNEQAIEQLYDMMQQLFEYASSIGFKGITLTDYAKLHIYKR